jgi:uncharacterized membrane protein
VYPIILLGVATGMRAMTPMAVLCWAARLGYLPLEGTWAIWVTTPGCLMLFTVAALFEYLWDTWPWIPSRTSAPLLAGRLGMGALGGALLSAVTREPVAGGVLLALVGVLIGAFGGVRVRMLMVRLVPWYRTVGLAESALALGISVMVTMRFYVGYVDDHYPWVLQHWR